MDMGTTKHRKTIISHGDGFRWEIDCYEDVTEISYYEKQTISEASVPAVYGDVLVQRFSIGQGFDLEVFQEAIKMRKACEEEQEKEKPIPIRSIWDKTKEPRNGKNN